MTIHTLCIINRDGGLIYHRHFSEEGSSAGVDMRLAASFYVMYAMACQIAPTHKSSGIKEFVADTFKLVCHQSATGVKFYFIASVSHRSSQLDNILQSVYENYVDFVMKNPFYPWDQPIKCAKFDRHLDLLIEPHNKDAQQ